jgi:hypothetical protein
MAADCRSPFTNRQSLVRLGRLCFDDFLLLAPETLDTNHWTPDLLSDWRIATNNTPHILKHLRLRIADLGFASTTVDSIRAAQARVVSTFALDLLKAKAPPLYDALPWQDWDFSIVAKRFKLWQTRFLLAGDGATVTVCRCRRSAGVYVVEPNAAIAGYVERKAMIAKVRRFLLLSRKPQAASLKLSGIPLPDNSVDLAVIGSVPSLETDSWQLVLQELRRVSPNVLLVENNPLVQPLDDKLLADSGFRLASVEVRGPGQRRCWWLLRHSIT